MDKYIGTKLIEAEPAFKVDSKIVTELPLSTGDKAAQQGYKVKYPDDYVSWSPKDVFKEAYRKNGNLSFDMALDMLKKKLFSGMRLPQWKPDVVIKIQWPDEHSKMTAPYLYVESRFGKIPWKETMIELFSEKWELVE
jgi:hypothetical protein